MVYHSTVTKSVITKCSVCTNSKFIVMNSASLQIFMCSRHLKRVILKPLLAVHCMIM